MTDGAMPGGEGLLAGAATTDITPAYPCRLAGYPERRERWTRVDEPLHARAVVLRQGVTTVAIVSLEVMAVDVPWTDGVRARAAAELGLDPDAVLIAATHTHSAQGGLFAYDGQVGAALQALLEDGEGPCDHRLRADLADAVIACLRKARAELRPATAQVGRAQVAGIGSNRLLPAAPVDQRCLYVAFDAVNGQRIAALVHYACHPTVLASTDLVISPDFPGVAVRALDASLGGIHLFLNGALGDVSTRDSRRAQTRDEVERFGRLLAGFATTASDHAKAFAVELWSAHEVVELFPKRNRPAPLERRIEALRRRIQASGPSIQHGDRRRDVTALEGALLAERLRRPLQQIDRIDLEVQLVRLSREVRLVGVPVELFSGLGPALEAAVPGTTAVVGPANGYLGYVPTADGYAKGGYEADSSLVAAGSGEVLVAAIARRIKGLTEATEPAGRAAG